MNNDVKFKVISVLSFDGKREKELVNKLDDLRSRHKLGEFLSHCIRVTWENPELLKKNGKSLVYYGLTDDRAEFFKGVKVQVKQLSDKVDKIYDMSLKTYTLAQFGKKTGLEKKSESTLMAGFIMQRQIDEISRNLGVSISDYIWESNKLLEVSKKADEILEYILESYENIIEDLKKSMVPEERQAVSVNSDMQDQLMRMYEVMAKTMMNIQSGENVDTNVGLPAEPTSEYRESEVIKSEHFDTGKIVDLSKKDNEGTPSVDTGWDEGVISFADADWDDLEKFVGM